MQVDAVRIDVPVLQKVLRQRDGHLRRSLAPIVELRREHDHVRHIADGLRAEVLDHVRAHALEVKPFPAGQRDEQRVGLASIITFGDIAAEVDVANRGMQHVVVDEPPLHLRSGGDRASLLRECGLRRRGLALRFGRTRARLLRPGRGKAQRGDQKQPEDAPHTCRLTSLNSDRARRASFRCAGRLRCCSSPGT